MMSELCCWLSVGLVIKTKRLECLQYNLVKILRLYTSCSNAMPASDRWTQSSRDHKNKVMGFDITRESSIEKSCSFALEGKVSAQSRSRPRPDSVAQWKKSTVYCRLLITPI